MITAPKSSPGETALAPSKSFTRFFPVIARFLMGLPLFIFGLNAFLNFIPQPKAPMAAGAMAFAGALMATGYMMQLIGVTQLVVGALLLANRFVPAALTILGALLVNIVLFHAFMAPAAFAPAVIAVTLWSIVFAHERAAFRPLLVAKNA